MHELVTINTDRINARFNYEKTQSNTSSFIGKQYLLFRNKTATFFGPYTILSTTLQPPGRPGARGLCTRKTALPFHHFLAALDLSLK